MEKIMKNSFWSGVVVLSLMISAGAQAAPNMVISSDTIPEGGNASISMVFQQDGVVTDFSFDLDYDETQFTATPSCGTPIPTTPSGSTSATCNVVDVGGGDLVVRVLVPPVFANPIPKIAAPDPTIGTVTFANIGATVGTYALEVKNPVYFNSTDGPQVPGTPSTNGQIVVQGAVYSGTPSGLTTMSVIQGQADPTGTVTINNVGAANTTLTGSCAITDNPTIFAVESGSPFSILQGSGPTTVVVSCDSSQAIATHTGELTCTPTSGDNPPVAYALQCNITEGPQPVFNSVPAAGSTITMSATYEGDPIPDETIEIDNDNGQEGGDPLILSVLNSTAPCSISGGGGKISLTSNGTFSIEKGAAHDFETIQCDSSEWDGGSPYVATLTCPHNDVVRTPAVYNIECSVGPKEPAEFDSTPASGTSTDMTEGDVKTGDTIPDQTLTLRNIVQPLGADMSIDCGFIDGPGEIEVTPLGTNVLAPGDATSVTFSCPNDVAAESQATYRCTWSSVTEEPNETVENGTNEDFFYTCEVREAEANVVSEPPNGAVITRQVPGGGTGDFAVAFSIEPNEGVDGELVSCTVDDDVNFQILSPSFPAVVPSVGSVVVNVQGSDPGGTDELSTTLTCETRDSNTGEALDEWTYTLVMEIGSFATFRVTKFFDDDNPGTVRVELHCNHGLPLIQGFNISQTQDVNFVLHSFDDGVPDCTVVEVDLEGYETSYWASGESNPSHDDEGCYFEEVGRGDVNQCQLTNNVLPVPVDVTKEWFVAGNSGNQYALEATITVSSPTMIVGGYPCVDNGDSIYYGYYCKHLSFSGPNTDTQTVMVYPAWDGVTVNIEEDLAESYIDSDNHCDGDVTIYPADGASCTITNTVFFEGIPTLNQYGLAILVLLMLGVGMVGFRRFS
jgi:hypothetical protein